MRARDVENTPPIMKQICGLKSGTKKNYEFTCLKTVLRRIMNLPEIKDTVTVASSNCENGRYCACLETKFYPLVNYTIFVFFKSPVSVGKFQHFHGAWILRQRLPDGIQITPPQGTPMEINYDCRSVIFHKMDPLAWQQLQNKLDQASKN